jgi:hypothetical protein
MCGMAFGSSHVFARMAVGVFGARAVAALRTLFGGVVLTAVAVIGGQRGSRRPWQQYAVLGAVSAAAPCL